jgi:hypothetical protein
MALRPYFANRAVASAAVNPFGVVSSFRSSAEIAAESAVADRAEVRAGALSAKAADVLSAMGRPILA